MRYSLKTEADKEIKPDRILMSKFREGKGLSRTKTEEKGVFRDRSDEELCEGLVRVIKMHLENYDRVVSLRAFVINRPKPGVRYDLVEIPKPVLEAVETLVPTDFSPRTGAGGSRANVRFDGKPAWTLVFDGSDEKITIARLDVSLCRIHASWFIPSLSTTPIPDPESS